jgi:hypothetical protein
LDSGAKDNFFINESTGIITVAQDSVLDIQQNGDTYQIKVRKFLFILKLPGIHFLILLIFQVNVVDGGKPFPRTGETMVTITIEDDNDKPPKFQKVQ